MIQAQGGGVAAAQIGTVHYHPEVGAPAAVVLPVTGDSASSREFVGRDEELAELLNLLDPEISSGVVAVSGMAGVGKTALAWQAAGAAAGRGWFPGGAVFVDMRGYDPDAAARVVPERLYASLLRALDPSMPVADMPATIDEQATAYHHLMAHLDQVSRPVLLVLDNAGTTTQVSRLLPTGKKHRVVITSRHLLGELPSARLIEVDILAPDFAVELLVSTLDARNPGDPRLSADPQTAEELARLCGYLPLALQIIAALLASEPKRLTSDLVDELTHESTRLQGLSYEWWTVRAAFELSYRHLDTAPAQLFRLLAVLPGRDVTAKTAAALAAQPVLQVRRDLAALTRAHLLECRQPGRWCMHDLIRLYAAELATSHAHNDYEDQAMTRLLSFYCDITRVADRRLVGQVDRRVPDDFGTAAEARSWLQAERPNLIAAVAQAARASVHRERAIEISLSLSEFLAQERHLDDWVATATAALHAATELGDRYSEGAALNSLGLAQRQVGRLKEAIDSHQRSVDICRELDDQESEGKILTNLGVALAAAGRFEEAIDSHKQSLAICRELGNRYNEGSALTNLGIVLHKVGRFDEAIECHDLSLTICREFGDRPHEGSVLGNLGAVFAQVERFDEAIASHQQHLVICREFGYRHREGLVLNHLGHCLAEMVKFEEAITHFQQSVEICREVGDREGEGRALNNLGLAQRQVGHFEEAIASHRRAVNIYRDLGDHRREGRALNDLGLALRQARRLSEAREIWEQALELFVERGIDDAADQVRQALADRDD